MFIGFEGGNRSENGQMGDAGTRGDGIVRPRVELWRIVAGLLIFSAAFGYVEAAVVAYLRSIYTPLRVHLYPRSSGELFPLLSVDQLLILGPEHIVRLKTELGRELATLLVLTGAALSVARNLREWVAAFLVCFGIWDITFYIFLKLLLDWPASFLTWDILFLIPVPWTGPVIAPVLSSLSMIGCGLILLRREYDNKTVYITRLRWALILLGGALVIGAFVSDFWNISTGGYPNPFNWVLFLSGEAVGLLSFVSSLRHTQRIGDEA
jgi:hypothetical protein